MGHNMMRKDGAAHMAERFGLFPPCRRRRWGRTGARNLKSMRIAFSTHSRQPGRRRSTSPSSAAALGECLKSVTGLTNIRYQEMDAWSQGIIDGIANYTGERRSRRAAMRRLPASTRRWTTCCRWCAKTSNHSLLSVMIHGGMPEANVHPQHQARRSRGGQNKPRKAIAGCIWALLTHPDQFALAARGQGLLAAGVRGIRALDFADRHVAAAKSSARIPRTPAARRPCPRAQARTDRDASSSAQMAPRDRLARLVLPAAIVELDVSRRTLLPACRRGSSR